MNATERAAALDDLLITVVEQGYPWFGYRHYRPSGNDADYNKVGVTRVDVCEADEKPLVWTAVSGDSLAWKAAASKAAAQYRMSLDAFLEDQDVNMADLAMQYLLFDEERYA